MKEKRRAMGPMPAGLPGDGLMCAICGCMETRACLGGCFWLTLDPPVCSTCAALLARAVVNTIRGEIPKIIGKERAERWVRTAR